MIRGWFDAQEAVLFARELARDIDKLFPLTSQRKRPASAKKDRKKLDGLVLRTQKFAQHHRMNVYKKAKLLNTIKWELRDSGHDDALIDEVVGLLAPLAAIAPPRSPQRKARPEPGSSRCRRLTDGKSTDDAWRRIEPPTVQLQTMEPSAQRRRHDQVPALDQRRRRGAVPSSAQS